MLYDVRLELRYRYDGLVSGARHHVRVTPQTLDGVLRVVAASLTFDPRPQHESTFTDFFGNSVSAIGFRQAQDHLDVRLAARISVEERRRQPLDLSPTVARLADELSANWSLAPGSPHHFTGNSPRVTTDDAITAYARQSTLRTSSVMSAVADLGRTIHADFAYESEVTDAETTASRAFALRRGVCQDFAHVMIAGLRGVGIPAGYVSGFLRTVPPPGEPRLEGTDAMHAWVRAWCGAELGWFEYDPTNAMPAGPDHITVGYGRDYADISPIVGVFKASGGHQTSQSVDVVAAS
jgi:transglutaminase-like putative cysteine protease